MPRVVSDAARSEPLMIAFGEEGSNSHIEVQSLAFCQLNYPRAVARGAASRVAGGARTRGLQVHGRALSPSELRPPCPWQGSNLRTAA